MRTSALWRYCTPILVACAVALAFVNGHAAASNDAKPSSLKQDAPRIQIKEPTYDFGEVLEGIEVEHEFVVANTGGEPLEITKVRPG